MSKVRLYHIRLGKSVASKLLIPRIPKNNYFINSGLEDNTIERICFCESINECVLAKGMKKGAIFNVFYIDIDEKDIYRPTKDEVCDVELSNEIWVMKPVKVKYYGKFKAENYLETRRSILPNNDPNVLGSELRAPLYKVKRVKRKLKNKLIYFY